MSPPDPPAQQIQCPSLWILDIDILLKRAEKRAEKRYTPHPTAQDHQATGGTDPECVTCRTRRFSEFRLNRPAGGARGVVEDGI